MNKNLIYGKSGIDRIVGAEVNDGCIELFIQNEDGNVVSEFKPIKHWLLSDEQLSRNAKRLEGDLHYKWGHSFDNMETWRKMRSIWGRNKDVYSIWNQEEATMVRYGMSFFQGLKHNEVSILSFDIETNGLEMNDESHLVLISNTFRDSKGNYCRKVFSYLDYASIQLMIIDWCDWVREKDPSIICGHNIFDFDLKYLFHCSGGSLPLGRNGSNLIFDNYESKFRKDGSQFIHYNKAFCYGRTFIDTMFLSIKYDVGRKYENYRLKDIVRHEGLEKADRAFYDASQIRFKYKDPEEMKKIVAYAMDDSDDALKLYDLMAPPIFYSAQSIPKTYQEIMLSATGSQINSILVRAYLQEGHSIPKADNIEGSFQGAISYGKPGIYNNAVRWDVTSLYPSIMIAFNVYDIDKDPKAYFLEVVKTFTVERIKNKKLAKETNDKYYDDLQSSAKTTVNSMYGFMGAQGLNFNCLSGASFVTEKGREILTKAIEWSTGKNENEIRNLLNN